MIIDVHYHMIPFPPPQTYKAMLDRLGEPTRLAKVAGIKIDKDTLARRAAEMYPDAGLCVWEIRVILQRVERFDRLRRIRESYVR